MKAPMIRLKIGGEGALGSAAETPDITRERRALIVWRQQWHALIEASSASPHTDIDWHGRFTFFSGPLFAANPVRRVGRSTLSESLSGS